VSKYESFENTTQTEVLQFPKAVSNKYAYLKYVGGNKALVDGSNGNFMTFDVLSNGTFVLNNTCTPPATVNNADRDSTAVNPYTGQVTILFILFFIFFIYFFFFFGQTFWVSKDGFYFKMDPTTCYVNSTALNDVAIPKFSTFLGANAIYNTNR